MLRLCVMPPDAQDPESLSTDDFARWWKETGEHELRQILFWKWHPIGVLDSFPNTADEYDGYAPQVVGALRRSATKGEIASLLLSFEHDAMGLSRASGGRLGEVARLLGQWYENSQDSWSDFGPVRR